MVLSVLESQSVVSFHLDTFKNSQAPIEDSKVSLQNDRNCWSQVFIGTLQTEDSRTYSKKKTNVILKTVILFEGLFLNI